MDEAVGPLEITYLLKKVRDFLPVYSSHGDYGRFLAGLDRIVTELMEAAAAQHRPNPAPEDVIEKLPRTELTYDCSPISFRLSVSNLTFPYRRSSEEGPILCDMHRILCTSRTPRGHLCNNSRGSIRDRAREGQGDGGFEYGLRSGD
jgi:hypothetical protein